MKNPTAYAASFRTALATAALLALGGVLVAQTMTTRGSGSNQRVNANQICVLTVPDSFVVQADRKGNLTSISAKQAQVVIDATVWWDPTPPTPGANPSVTYSIKLGLRNTSSSNWTTPVKFVLADVRPDWYPNEPINAPLTTASAPRGSQQAPITVSLALPASGVAPNATLMSAPVQGTVVWRQRPGLMIHAFDVSEGKHLGSCYLDEMTAVRPPRGRGGLAAGESQEPAPPAPVSRPAPVPGLPVPRSGGGLQ